jgi:hypothetical protein
LSALFLSNRAGCSWPRQPSNPHLSRFRSNQRARINPERKGKRLNEECDGGRDAQEKSKACEFAPLHSGLLWTCRQSNPLIDASLANQCAYAQAVKRGDASRKSGQRRADAGFCWCPLAFSDLIATVCEKTNETINLKSICEHRSPSTTKRRISNRGWRLKARPIGRAESVSLWASPCLLWGVSSHAPFYSRRTNYRE